MDNRDHKLNSERARRSKKEAVDDYGSQFEPRLSCVLTDLAEAIFLRLLDLVMEQLGRLAGGEGSGRAPLPDQTHGRISERPARRR